ncbi:receptor-like protein EIX2 [Miscanthus floridulus]|uniref:receptor-like protein EIX2 n=1 Tax=Miscanthus floridulus TaxID=154761 RepID=UPI0034575002
MRCSAPTPSKLMLLLAAAGSFLLSMTTIAHALQPPDPGLDSGATCMPHQRDALLAFKQGITGDPAGILDTWQQQPDGGHGDGEQDCCRWRGVRCSSRTGHVIELRLGNANYDIDCDATALVGQISRSLLALEHLQHLDLSYNNLSGPTGRIPEFLGSLKKLKYLNLSGIGFHGSVPPQLGNLTQLQYLDLFSSSSVGAAYSTDLSWLAHLRLLRYLNLGSVNLSTVADWPHVVAMLPFLTVLRLPGCSLSGMLPERVAQLTSLVALDLSRNSFTGPLPEFIGNLTGLRILDFSSNKFTGPLPASVRYITGLRTLDVSYNNLTGLPREVGTLSSLTGLYVSHNSLEGAITEEYFRSLKSLQHLDLSSNFLKIEISTKWKPPFVRLRSANFADCKMGPLFPAWLQWLVGIEYLDISSAGINDRIPDWFPAAFSNARFLSMSKNQLSGELPANMDIMSSLDELDLSNNSLSGLIPKLPHNLTYLDICINSLSGSLPADLGLPNLQVLSVASNSITGSVPRSICKSQGLRTLVLANNHLEGQLPNCFGNSVMLFLDFSNNNFSGMLPASMQNCEMLQVLDLSRNMFSGRLPAWIGKLKRLRFLRLRQNMFSGNIPMNLTSLACLQYLDIADNGISGSLPRNLSDLKSLKQKQPTEMCSDVFHVRVFAVNFSTFLKGQQLSYGSIPRIVGLNMTVIDLSFNSITGEIPEEIATLDGLLNLNLSKNHFSGNVPSKIGAMQSLESLDLSGNKLSGEIPASLSTLTFLSYLDLSYNNLTGAIPSGSQLDTLYAEHPYMYNGNIGLCGPPLKNNCLKTNASEQGPITRTDEEGRWQGFFYIGLGYGFLAGIWLVSCSLLFMKNWRIAYFRHFDKLYDKAYVLLVTWWAKADQEDLLRS